VSSRFPISECPTERFWLGLHCSLTLAGWTTDCNAPLVTPRTHDWWVFRCTAIATSATPRHRKRGGGLGNREVRLRKGEMRAPPSPSGPVCSDHPSSRAYLRSEIRARAHSTSPYSTCRIPTCILSHSGGCMPGFSRQTSSTSHDRVILETGKFASYLLWRQLRTSSFIYQIRKPVDPRRTTPQD
jgi:hypothetical protein